MTIVRGRLVDPSVGKNGKKDTQRNTAPCPLT